jgi:hypothetical protein
VIDSPKLCECGKCGLPAPIATQTSTKMGWVKGQPKRFIRGHYAHVQPLRPLAERFWLKVDKNGPMPNSDAIAIHPEITGLCCWLFSGKDVKGKRVHHPRIHLYEIGTVPAHHVAWYLATGDWPWWSVRPDVPEPCILHKCDRPRCVRFEHLFQGTQDDNVHDMMAKKRDRFVDDKKASTSLTREQVAEIRRLGAPWIRSRKRRSRAMVTLLRQLAERFGVGKVNISLILRNRSWRSGVEIAEAA